MLSPPPFAAAPRVSEAVEVTPARPGSRWAPGILGALLMAVALAAAWRFVLRPEARGMVCVEPAGTTGPAGQAGPAVPSQKLVPAKPLRHKGR